MTQAKRGTRALITGASSGIGAACAEVFAERGYELLLLARREERLVELKSELERKHSVKVSCFSVDVSDRMAVERFAQEQHALLAELDLLVNNAGLAKGLSTIQDGNPDDWKAMLSTNVEGLLWVTRAIFPHFLKRNAGHIVNIGSVAGLSNYPKGNVYCATKSAVHSLSECMRLDLNGTGIRVTEICPGMVETEFSVVRLGDETRAKNVYAGMTPLTGRDVAETVLWSVERPKHVNIQEIVIYPTDQASPTVVSRNQPV